MALGDPFLPPVPAVTTVGPGYATAVNLVLDELIDRVSSRLDISAVNWGADADLENHGLENAAFVGMYDQDAVSDEVGRIHSFNGDLYFISASGAVQITSGGGLNAAGIGGIVGDYGSPNPAAVFYVDASSTYEFYEDLAAATWAGVKAGNFQLESTTTPGAVATLDFAGTGDVTYTLPPAAPAGTALLRMESDGDINTTADITVSPTFDADIILSGSRKIQHGQRRILFKADRTVTDQSGTTAPANTSYTRAQGWEATSAAAAVLFLPIQGLHNDWRVTGWEVRVLKTTVDLLTTTFRYVTTNASGVEVVASDDTATSTTTGVQTITGTLATPVNLTDSANQGFYVMMDLPATGDLWYSAVVLYDVPA